MLLCLPILFSFQFTFLAIGMIVEDEYYLFIVGSAINFVGFLESLATNLFTSKLVNSFSYISYDKFVKLKAKMEQLLSLIYLCILQLFLLWDSSEIVLSLGKFRKRVEFVALHDLKFIFCRRTSKHITYTMLYTNLLLRFRKFEILERQQLTCIYESKLIYFALLVLMYFAVLSILFDLFKFYFQYTLVFIQSLQPEISLYQKHTDFLFACCVVPSVSHCYLTS